MYTTDQEATGKKILPVLVENIPEELRVRPQWVVWKATGLANDPVGFRTALKGWEQAGIEALKRARVKGGAA